MQPTQVERGSDEPAEAEATQREARGAPPRLLFVISSLEIGGPQKSLIGLLQRIDHTRFDVSVAVLCGETGPLARWMPDEVRQVTVPSEISAAILSRGAVRRNLRLLYPGLRLRTKFALLWVLARGVPKGRGRQVMRQRAWSTVHHKLPKMGGSYDAAFGILGSSTMAVVDLVDSHHKYHWVRSDTRILGRDERIDGSYFERLTGAISVSASCARIFEDMYPSSRGRVVVYKNDIPRLESAGHHRRVPSASPGTMTLLTISRLDRLKGIDIAIDACAKLVQAGHRVRWIVVGEGPERSPLEVLIRERGVQDHFVLWGQSHEIPALLSAADLYVHPSRTEGRSNAVEEARASGLPIVATAYDTVADQVTDLESGLVCEISPDGVADAVAILLADPALARRLGATAADAYASEVDDPNALLGLLSVGSIAKAIIDRRE